MVFTSVDSVVLLVKSTAVVWACRLLHSGPSRLVKSHGSCVNGTMQEPNHGTASARIQSAQ